MAVVRVGERMLNGRIYWRCNVYDYDQAQRAKQSGWKPLAKVELGETTRYELYFIGEKAPWF
jgi:hypothetical protein